MRPHTWMATMAALGLTALLTPTLFAQKDEPATDGVEVLARGPVHEAFAAPAQARPLPAQIVPKKPPDPIQEVPPDQKPADDQVIWIPGYWNWDDEAKDFLWVSGFWRIPPPNCQWMPGNWQQVQDGWQWTAGFWTAANQQEVQYLPAPPPSVDAGPSTPAPDANSTYVPGCWVYRQTRFLWQPGFWLGYQPDWVWSSSHYVWTPGGYVYVNGFWDRPLERRGLLFAPIHVASALLGTQWAYTPRYVVQPDFLLGALFVRPSYCHYYFGDYFEPGYARSGFMPWFDYRISKGSYDPNFAYYRHRYSDPRWERNLRGYYAGRTSGEIPRPPRTLVQQNTVITNITNNKTVNVNINKNFSLTNMQNVHALTAVTRIHNVPVTGLASLDPARAGNRTGTSHIIKMETMSRAQQTQARQAIVESRAAAQQRQLAEAKILSGSAAPTRATDPPRRVQLQPPKTTPIPRFGQAPARAKEPAPQPRKSSPQPQAQGRPQPQPRPQPPPQPKPPPQVERPIPPHQPPPPAKPPKRN